MLTLVLGTYAPSFFLGHLAKHGLSPVSDPGGQMPLQPKAAQVGVAAYGLHSMSYPGSGPFGDLCWEVAR